MDLKKKVESPLLPKLRAAQERIAELEAQIAELEDQDRKWRLACTNYEAMKREAEARQRQAWTDGDQLQEDVAALCRALGIGDHARPASAHEVLRQEILPTLERLTPFQNIGADRLADEVAALVTRGFLDSRSAAADALLDYREPPRSRRSDRLARLDALLASEEPPEGLIEVADDAFRRCFHDIETEAPVRAIWRWFRKTLGAG